MRGFYKLNDGMLIYAPNFVEGPNVSLRTEDHANYTYPVDGWCWFDTLLEVQWHFGFSDEELRMQLDLPDSYDIAA